MLELISQEDLQLKNRWYCHFRDFSKAPHLIKSVNLPTEKLVTETKKYGRKEYVGFEPVDSLSITFYENTAMDVYNFFKNWMDSIFDSKEKTYKVLASEQEKYKSANLVLYSYSNSGRVDTANFIFEYLMITGLDDQTFDQTTGEPLEWTVQLKVREARKI